MDWYVEIMEVSSDFALTTPVHDSAARELGKLLRERGYVGTSRLPGNRQQVQLTDKGRLAADPLFGKWARFIPLRGARTTQPRSKAEPELAGSPAAPKGSVVRTRRARRPTSPERKNANSQALSRKHERLNGVFRLSFRGNKIRYIQLLTIPEEWLGATLWPCLVTGFDQTGVEQCTAVFDDPAVRRVVPSEWSPQERVLALAAELERDGDTYKLATYIDENGEICPRVGVVAQSWFNFFRHITALDDPLRILRVKGTGTGLERRYEISQVADAMQLGTELSLDDVLATLKVEEHRERFERLPSGWFFLPPKRKELVWQLLGLDENQPAKTVRKGAVSLCKRL